MSPTLRHIPFRRLGTSDIHLRYLEEDQDLVQFLGKRPRNAAELLRKAPTGAPRLVRPESLSAAFTAYAERHGAPEPVLENARALADGNTQIVVTGQQPGLLGGPLFSLHKAATAVRLAQELSALPGAPRVVPVFWNHTDDHDLDEVNRAFLVNANLDVQRYRLDLERTGEPIRSLAAGRRLDHLLAAVDELMPESEFRDWALDIFRPRHPDEALGESTSRLMFELFGHHGLLVIEPRDLPTEAFDVLQRWWGQADMVRTSMRSIIEHLSDVGIDVTMDPGATLMFQLAGGRRVPLSEGDQVSEATDLSPGAMLRPLWQDACLPSLGFVVGPGELAYLGVVGPLYRTLGVPMPCLVPRSSLTLVEPSVARLMTRFGWDLPDLAEGPEALTATLAEKAEGGIDEELDELAAQVRSQFGDLVGKLAQADRQMVGAAERTRAKVVDEISRLAQKVRNSRQNREGTGQRQIRRLCSNLRPRGRLQERVLTPLPFMVAHGRELADQLVAAADPFRVEHGVLEL